MDLPMIPQEITVIILNGKKIVGRKEGVRNFSCVFGVGNKRFTTANDEVDDGNPKWNEEAKIPLKIDCKDDLTLKIMDNNKKIGKIILPLSDIPREETNSIKKLLFVPAQSFPNCCGEVSFKCWVSKVFPSTVGMTPKTGSMIFKNSKFFKRNSKLSIDWSSTKNSTLSVSSEKINDLSKHSTMESRVCSIRTKPTSPVGSNQSSLREEVFDQSQNLTTEIPHVTSIKPKRIRPDKKEKIYVHGRNFGSSLGDIIDVLIGGRSVIGNVIYHSSSLFFISIEPNTLQLNQGVKIFVTTTGGPGLCDATLTVQPKSLPGRDRRGDVSDNAVIDSHNGNPFLVSEEGDVKRNHKNSFDDGESEAVLNAKIANLSAKNADLITENESLRQSIDSIKQCYDQLLAKVMTECPELLEVL